jgi:hypothetical protein
MRDVNEVGQIAPEYSECTKPRQLDEEVTEHRLSLSLREKSRIE